MVLIKQTDCFDNNFQFWKLLGIYPLDINLKYYGMYSKIILFLCIFLYNGIFTINFHFLPRDLDFFVGQMIFFFTLLATMSKVVTYMISKEKIKKLLEMLDSEIFQPGTKNGMQIITKAKKFNVRYWKIVAAVSYYSDLVYMLTPLLSHWFASTPLELNCCSFDFLDNDFKEKYIFPIYVYQHIGMHFNMLCNLNIDTFFLGLLIYTIAQLELLEEELINVTNKDNNVLRKENLNRISHAPVPHDSAITTKLNNAFKHYESVSKFCSLIEEVFSVTLFVQFYMASCIICICLFRFTSPATSDYYMFLASYMFIMIVQIMVPCWFGTRIMDKSSLLSRAIYSCDWTPRSQRFKSSLRLFVERANRPLSITGWKLFPVSLNTFTSIMNSAYSFLTLLRNMQSREE